MTVVNCARSLAGFPEERCEWTLDQLVRWDDSYSVGSVVAPSAVTVADFGRPRCCGVRQDDVGPAG